MRTRLRDWARTMGTARLYARLGLSRITPRKAFRMLRYWVLTTLFRKEIPWVLEFSITYRCQCRCKHCSVSNYFAEARSKKELTNDEIKEVLRQAAEMGIPKVDLFGGEPLMKEGVADLVRYGERLGLYMSATTNAWLLSKEMVGALKDAGISCINISLDSVNEEKHDRLRGLPGLHKRVIAGIGFCKEAGVPSVVSTYVTRNRMRGFAKGEADESELSQILALSRKLGASAVRVLFPILSGEWIDQKAHEFTEEEKSFVIENIDPAFVFIEGAYSVKAKKKVCQALRGKLINISPYGDLQLCIAFPDAFGNVRDGHLAEQIQAMWSHPVYCKNKNGDCCSTRELVR